MTPSCVQTCPAEARIAGDLNDPNSEISKILNANNVDVLNPDAGTNPQCFYIDLDGDVYTMGGGSRD